MARKHCVNWYNLLMDALLARKGLYRSRAGGSIFCDARTLLRQLVNLEKTWRTFGEILDVVNFENDSLIIKNYFGKNFSIPLNTWGLKPPLSRLKLWPFDVMGDVVLDIGAYLGDTPLMWLYKGAKQVIAVEPVPLHFEYLKKNVAGLPVVCLKASLAIQLPFSPREEGSSRYGLRDETNNDQNTLNVPVVQLLELVETYRPTVVKLSCNGCEHYVLEQLTQITKLGVKKIAVVFCETKGFDPYRSIDFLEKELGKGVKTLEKVTSISHGKHMRVVTVYWLIN